MNIRQGIYLVLALLGAILTWSNNIAFMRESGANAFDAMAFIEAVFVNHASSSIGWDITIACAAFITWMLHEAKTIGMKHAWVYVVLTLGIAFAFAAPLFLFMRECHLDARKQTT